jgi:divalent metal cation (Fe/Co/Zn/Cd) transporter
MGRQMFIEMHMIVDTNDVNTAHQITEEVEDKLAEKFNPVRVIIHVEPPHYHSNRITFENEPYQ